jgi:hypothetical protein
MKRTAPPRQVQMTVTNQSSILPVVAKRSSSPRGLEAVMTGRPSNSS